MRCLLPQHLEGVLEPRTGHERTITIIRRQRLAAALVPKQV